MVEDVKNTTATCLMRVRSWNMVDDHFRHPSVINGRRDFTVLAVEHLEQNDACAWNLLSDASTCNLGVALVAYPRVAGLYDDVRY